MVRNMGGEVSRAQLAKSLVDHVMESFCLKNSEEQKRHGQIFILEPSQCGE